MKNELAIVPADLDIYKLGEVFHKSGYFKDIRDASQAVVKILAGRELGFEPMMSLMGIHIIEGKPSLSANLLAACVKRSGRYDYRVKETTNDRCAIEFLQVGPLAIEGRHRESLGVSEFTMQDAQRAGVVRQGGGWSKYPKAMLFARALSQGVRTYCPDVTMGTPAYVPEELGAEVNEEGDVISAPSTPAPKAATPVSREPVEIGRKREAAATPTGAPTVEASTVASDSKKGAASPAAKPPVVTQGRRQEDFDGHVVTADGRALDKPATPKPPDIIAELQERNRADANEADQVQARSVNFHRVFERALPDQFKKKAKVIAHQWLADKGYLDADGQPSAKAIPEVDYLIAREAAEAWARKVTA